MIRRRVGPLSNGAPIAALPATEATDAPKPSPGVGAENVTGGVNARGTKAGGTSLTVIEAVAVLIPPKPSLTVSGDGERPHLAVGVHDRLARRRRQVAERPSVSQRATLRDRAIRCRQTGSRRPRRPSGVVKPITAVGGVSLPKACENSDVLPSGSVAVAETNGGSLRRRREREPRTSRCPRYRS